MALNLRSCGRVFAVALALAANACTPVVLTGDYRPRRVPALEPEFAVTVRSVTVRTSSIRGETLGLADFRESLQAAIERDLHASGPFRAPDHGETPYTLDVSVLTIETAKNRRYLPATVLGGVALGVPFLFGAPIELEKQSSVAVFQLYSPDGTLVLEQTMANHRNIAAGVYTGRRTLGAAFAPFVRDLKLAAERQRRQIRDGVAATRFYDPRDGELARIVDCLGPDRGSAHCQQFARLTPAPPPAAAPPPQPLTPSAAPPPPTHVTAAPQPATVVLAIGIDRYRDAPPADGAEADARRVDELFARTFKVPNNHRRLLLGDRATRSDIDDGLRWLAEQSRRGARAVVYFSGHGAPHPTTGEPQLVPFEADPADLARTAVSLADLERRLAAMPARDAVLIVDACFSGQGNRSLAVPGVRPLVHVQPTAHVVRLAAASASETASATPDGAGGLFTHYLLEALGKARADHDGDGRITLEELSAWLTPRVAAAARARGRAQTPSLARADIDTGDVVLGWGYPLD